MTKQHVIVIDDEPETVDMLKQFLELFEFEVTGALTGTGGMKLATSTTPQAVILDLMLPDADGYQICRLLRHHPNLKKMPIVILSARVGKEDELKGLACGATVYLRKPIDLNKLIDELRHAIETGHIPAKGVRPEPPPGAPDSARPAAAPQGAAQDGATPSEPQFALKGKRSTVHIPGMYIPRDKDDSKKTDH